MPSIRPLPDALAKKAREELNEVEERIPADIEALRTWLSKQKHLITPTGEIVYLLHVAIHYLL